MYQEYEYTSRVVSLNQEQGVKLNYPCLIVEGIEYPWELQFLMNREYEPKSSLPLYIYHSEKYFPLTRMDLTASSVLTLKEISNNCYKLHLKKSEDHTTLIDYNDPVTLIKLISIGKG